MAVPLTSMHPSKSFGVNCTVKIVAGATFVGGLVVGGVVMTAGVGATVGGGVWATVGNGVGATDGSEVGAPVGSCVGGTVGMMEADVGAGTGVFVVGDGV